MGCNTSCAVKQMGRLLIPSCWDELQELIEMDVRLRPVSDTMQNLPLLCREGLINTLKVPYHFAICYIQLSGIAAS